MIDNDSSLLFAWSDTYVTLFIDSWSVKGATLN